MEITQRSLWLMARSLMKDARVQAMAGSREDREDLEQWVQGADAPWTFEGTCELLKFTREQTERMRKDILKRLAVRKSVQ